jgi:hypothetical protein
MSEQADEVQQPDPNIIQLKNPYTLPSGALLTQVRWRRLKAKDLMKISKQAGKDEAMVEMYGIAMMLSMIPEDVMEMDGEDFYIMKGRFFDILGVGQGAVASQGAAG